MGAIAGWVAGLVTGSHQGLLKDIVVGMIGSIIGGMLVILVQTGTLDFTTAFTSFNVASILVSTLGAIVLIAVAKLL